MRDANKQRKSIKDLIDSLPATNRAVLFSIISVLDKISQSCSLNKVIPIFNDNRFDTFLDGFWQLE